MKRVIFIIALLLTIGNHSDADVLAQYSFDNSLSISLDLDAPTVASTFNDGPGLTGTFDTTRGNPAPSRSVAAALTGADQATAISGNDYFTFTLTPTTGFKFSLTSLTFDKAIFGTGNPSATFFLRSSIDNYATNIGSVTTTSTTFSNTSFSLTGASFQNVNSALSFRIYVFDDNNGSGKGDLLDNIIVNGVTAPDAIVPEPSTWAILVTGAGLLFGLRRFRRR